MFSISRALPGNPKMKIIFFSQSIYFMDAISYKMIWEVMAYNAIDVVDGIVFVFDLCTT